MQESNLPKGTAAEGCSRHLPVTCERRSEPYKIRRMCRKALIAQPNRYGVAGELESGMHVISATLCCIGCASLLIMLTRISKAGIILSYLSHRPRKPDALDHDILKPWLLLTRGLLQPHYTGRLYSCACLPHYADNHIAAGRERLYNLLVAPGNSSQ